MRGSDEGQALVGAPRSTVVAFQRFRRSPMRKSDSAGMTCAERPMSRPRHVDTMEAKRGAAPRSRMVAFQRLRRSLMSSLAAASRPSERILSVVDISPRGLLGLRRAPGWLTPQVVRAAA